MKNSYHRKNFEEIIHLPFRKSKTKFVLHRGIFFPREKDKKKKLSSYTTFHFLHIICLPHQFLQQQTFFFYVNIKYSHTMHILKIYYKNQKSIKLKSILSHLKRGRQRTDKQALDLLMIIK